MTILDTRPMPISELRGYRKNPRRGNVGMIKESLELHGQYRAVVVNKGTQTGRPNEVLAGNHTVLAARELGWASLEVHLLDVSNEEAAKIVLADNRLNDIATYDNDELIELLGELEDLAGTGFTDEDIQALITPPEDVPEDEGSPGGEFDVIVACTSASDQFALMSRMEHEGRKVRTARAHSEV